MCPPKACCCCQLEQGVKIWAIVLMVFSGIGLAFNALGFWWTNAVCSGDIKVAEWMGIEQVMKMCMEKEIVQMGYIAKGLICIGHIVRPLRTPQQDCLGSATSIRDRVGLIMFGDPFWSTASGALVK